MARKTHLKVNDLTFSIVNFGLLSFWASLSCKSSPHAFQHHLALFLFFIVVASLSHNLPRTLPKSYSQSICLNRHGPQRFLYLSWHSAM